MKTKRLVYWFLVATLLAGCVRFIPSRADLNKPYGNDPSIEYVGRSAFYLYDREQRSRLAALIKKRIANAPEKWDSAYRIGAGDQVRIDVKNFEEISREYKVNPDGFISLPFVGKQQVAGLTDSEIADRVAKVVEDYVLEPQVHVEVTDYSAYKVWLMGGQFDGVSGTGNDTGYKNRAFPLRRPNYSLVELLVETGEAELLASGGVIYIYPQGGLYSVDLLSKKKITSLRRTTLEDMSPFCNRNSEGWATDGGEDASASCGPYQMLDSQIPLDKKYHPKARIQIDVEELFGGISRPPLYVPLRPGDAIYIPPPPLIQVYGEVNARGSVRASRGTGGSRGGVQAGSVKPTLMSVLTEVRGLTYAADIHNLEIFRELEFGKKVVLKVDFEQLTLRGTQDIRLRDGDIVWVPSQSGRFSEQHSINAINSVLNAGNNARNTATQ